MNLCEAVRKAGERGAIRSKSVPITVGMSLDGWMQADIYARYHMHVSHLMLDDFEVKVEPREWWIRYPKMMADMHRMIGGESTVCVPEVWPGSESHPTVNGFPNDEWIRVREILEGES